jgi:MOSC domain-containing protein YiiM
LFLNTAATVAVLTSGCTQASAKVVYDRAMPAKILYVHCSSNHGFSKQSQSSIQLLAGLGVENDAHMGQTVKHRSRVAIDPSQANLRQVHLLHHELFGELFSKGFSVGPGDIGENITTSGLELLKLPTGTLLHLGDRAVVQVTGLRNPCNQLNDFLPGLMQALLEKDHTGALIRKAGIMGIVLASGEVAAGASIGVEKPAAPHRALERV